MTALSIPDGSELEDATDSTAQVDVMLYIGPFRMVTYLTFRFLND